METTPEIIAGLIQKVLEELTTAAGTNDWEDGLYRDGERCCRGRPGSAKEANCHVSGAAQGHHRLHPEQCARTATKSFLRWRSRRRSSAVMKTRYGRTYCAPPRLPASKTFSPGRISGDNGLMLLEYAPVGMIGALTPITNPTGTLINNSIGMISAGNAVIFNAHPSATNQHGDLQVHTSGHR